MGKPSLFIKSFIQKKDLLLNTDPANLLQAQRDYFGAHTYERTDQPRGEFFHPNWTGRGGDTTSRTYVV
jgi:6-phosphogluconate dehydrogenase